MYTKQITAYSAINLCQLCHNNSKIM